MSLHRYAKQTALVTFVLLIVGGLVHNTRSSLACPDWPLCFGQVFPRMEGGVLIEHSHRLLAFTVGMLTIGLLGGLWRRAQRTGERGLIGLGIGALLCVVFQGVLGGLTVLYRLPTWISTTHLAVSMIFFSLLIYITYRTRERAGRQPLSESVRRATALAAGAVYAQMVLGALMRHLGAGLACVELPLCQGSAWGAHWAVQVHMLHRWLGVAVAAIVLYAAVVTVRGARGRRGVQLVALLAPLLVVTQIALGIFSITSFLGVVPVTAHLGVAALLLASFVGLHLTARGELGVRAASASENKAIARASASVDDKVIA